MNRLSYRVPRYRLSPYIFSNKRFNTAAASDASAPKSAAEMPSEVNTNLAAGVAAAATIVEIGVIFAATDAVVGTSATRTRSGNALLVVVSFH